MAGHSKWANIKHRKGAQDKKRGKLHTKLNRAIQIAAKEGGGDPDSNPRLRRTIDEGLQANMTKDAIKRAIDRGTGAQEGDSLVFIRYEGYGPAGVAVMVDCLTDNRNRTVSEVRHALTKSGGSLGTDGSVAYLFEQQGLIMLDAGCPEEQLMEVAIEHGAEDIEAQAEGGWLVTTAPSDFDAVKAALQAAEIAIAHAEVSWIASSEVNLDVETAQKVLRLQETLEDLDDVQSVATNADYPDEVL